MSLPPAPVKVSLPAPPTKMFTWGIANYTDATARQYLIDTYHWTINDDVFDGSKTIKGSNNANTLNTTAKQTTLHGLGGNVTLLWIALSPAAVSSFAQPCKVLSIFVVVITLSLNINDDVFDGSKTIKGGNNANTLNTTAKQTTLHGLGGNDTLTGGTTDDILQGAIHICGSYYAVIKHYYCIY
jgi:Ca2+-binding RTX toxin-like protein